MNLNINNKCKLIKLFILLKSEDLGMANDYCDYAQDWPQPDPWQVVSWTYRRKTSPDSLISRLPSFCLYLYIILYNSIYYMSVKMTIWLLCRCIYLTILFSSSFWSQPKTIHSAQSRPPWKPAKRARIGSGTKVYGRSRLSDVVAKRLRSGFFLWRFATGRASPWS